MLSRRTLLASAVFAPFGASALAETLDDVVARAVQRSTLISWGDRVEPDSPAFSPGNLTADAASRQFGWDAIVLGVLPTPPGEDGVARAVMVVAHPAAQPRMLPPGRDTTDVLAGLQGASVLNLERHSDRWLVTDGGYQTRRVNGDTLCRITGPAAATVGDATRGIIAPTCGGIAPWGHALIAETPLAASSGYVVELQPNDPDAIPNKRSALGRFRRAGLLAAQTPDERAVVFMSENGANGRLFRFVSAAPISANNPDALDQGELSVGVLSDDLLRFVPVSGPVGGPVGEPVTDAADRSQGTGMDGPGGMALQSDGTLILACWGVTGSAGQDSLGRGNPDGRVLLLRPQGGDLASASFSVELALPGGDTGLGNPAVSHPSCLGVDAKGRVWIGADGSGVTLAEAGFTRITQLYHQPIAATIGGFGFGPDGGPAFTAVRHPGATLEASWARPATRWPTLRHDMPPQTTVVGLAVG